MVSIKRMQPELLRVAKSSVYPLSWGNDSTNHPQRRTLPLSPFHYSKARNNETFSVSDVPHLKGFERKLSEYLNNGHPCLETSGSISACQTSGLGDAGWVQMIVRLVVGVLRGMVV